MKKPNETFTDPICGMKVDPESAAAMVEREGKKVYFCSTHCRDKFVGRTDHEHGQDAIVTVRNAKTGVSAVWAPSASPDVPSANCPKVF